MPDGRVQLQYGHRRLRAVQYLGWRTMPVDVQTDISDEEMAARAWSENHNRQDFTAMDQARYFRKLVDAGWTQKAIAQRLRLSEPTISNTLRLLRLPEEVQAQVADGRISQRKAEALVPMFTWPAEMQEAAAAAFSEWLRPASIIEKAGDNNWSSDGLRRSVDSLKEMITYHLPADWRSVPFRDGPYRAAVCDDCSAKYDGRCYIHSCLEAKSNAWQEIKNAKVVEETGIRLAPVSLRYYEKTDLGNEELALLRDAGKLPDGPNACPNLRVVQNAYSFNRLPGKEYGLCCVHPGSKQCSCVVAAKGQRTRSSKVIWVSVRKDTADLLAKALDDVPLPLLRLVASLHRAHHDKDKLPTDRAELVTILVDALFSHHLAYEPEKNAVRSKKDIEEMLAIAGLTASWVETPATVGKRYDEIQAWLDGYMHPDDGLPTPEAMRTTLDELNRLHDTSPFGIETHEAQALFRRYSRLWTEAIALNDRVERAQRKPSGAADGSGVGVRRAHGAPARSYRAADERRRIEKMVADDPATPKGYIAPTVDQGSAEYIHNKLERIEGWLGTFSDPGDGLPTPAAVQGNIDNLARLSEAIAGIESEQDRGRLAIWAGFLTQRAVELQGRVAASYAANDQ